MCILQRFFWSPSRKWIGQEVDWHPSKDGEVSKARKSLQKSLLSRQGNGSLEKVQGLGTERVNTSKIHSGATAAVLGHYRVKDMEILKMIPRFLA